MTTAIEVAGVSKHFRLYHEQYKSLKERVIHGGRIPFDEFWALRDVNLDIEQGETVAIVGHNGSGKSTLLKCIAGIMRPSEGEIRTRGRLAAMLELGAGFHPDLTGRENIFLNASILGLSQEVIEERFDDIVGFAELEAFIDNQVKYYSSGMYVRLGFAVAIHMDPEILLVDEVLAVGDEWFQRRCLNRLREFQEDGRTIVLVTHNADMVPDIADRAAVLDHGDLLMVGSPSEAIRVLRERLFADRTQPAARRLTVVDDATAPDSAGSSEGDQAADVRVTFTRVELEFPGANHRTYLVPGEHLVLHASYTADGAIADPAATLSIKDENGYELFDANPRPIAVDRLPLQGVLSFAIEQVPFLAGAYTVTVGVTDRDGATIYGAYVDGAGFEIKNPGDDRGRVQLGVDVSVTESRGPETSLPSEREAAR